MICVVLQFFGFVMGRDVALGACGWLFCDGWLMLLDGSFFYAWSC
jgi:hypothetical protein